MLYVVSVSETYDTTQAFEVNLQIVLCFEIISLKELFMIKFVWLVILLS